MKYRLIRWINSFLGTTDKLYQLESEINLLSQRNYTLQQQVDLFKQVINVGVDVHNPTRNSRSYDRSWAVVCIQGKADYIAFVDLDPNEIRTIQMFLRNFERRNTTIDNPHFPKDIFFKF